MSAQGQQQDGRHVEDPGAVHGQVGDLTDLDVVHHTHQFTTKPGRHSQCNEPGVGAREQVMPETGK